MGHYEQGGYCVPHWSYFKKKYKTVWTHDYSCSHTELVHFFVFMADLRGVKESPFWV